MLLASVLPLRGPDPLTQPHSPSPAAEQHARSVDLRLVALLSVGWVKTVLLLLLPALCLTQTSARWINTISDISALLLIDCILVTDDTHRFNQKGLPRSVLKDGSMYEAVSGFYL